MNVWMGMRMVGPVAVSLDRLDQNFLCELRADAQAHIANLANNVGLLREQPHLLLFAKTHLAEPMCDFRRSRKLLDPHRSARPNMAQRADKRLRTFRIRFYPDRTIVHQKRH